MTGWPRLWSRKGTSPKPSRPNGSHRGQSIVCLERLAADVSAEPEYQHNLSARDWHLLGKYYRFLAERLERAGQLREAEKAAERSVNIYIRVAGDFPSAPDFWEGLAVSHRCLGRIYERREKPAQAQAQLLAASRVEKSLAARSRD
jgi:hypothetical protein